MQWNRRKFLVAGGATVSAAVLAGVGWAATSRSRTARWMRTLAQDVKRRIQPAPVRPTPETWSDQALTVGWLGHATVLINFYGVRILTDPVFASRIGVDLGLATLGPKRYVAPALPFAELPAVDLVLLSHAHLDHFDLPSLRRFRTPVATVTARRTRDLLASTRLREAVELGWGESTRLQFGDRGDLTVHAFEVRHWGRRWPNQPERGYNGYVLTREGRSVLFGGDTAYTARFADLRSRGPYEVAIMPIAAYQPWIRSHCTPEEAVAMADMAGARRFVPVHHLTFKLSDEPMSEPLERLETALQQEQGRLGLRQVGEHCRIA